MWGPGGEGGGHKEEWLKREEKAERAGANRPGKTFRRNQPTGGLEHLRASAKLEHRPHLPVSGARGQEHAQWSLEGSAGKALSTSMHTQVSALVVTGTKSIFCGHYLQWKEVGGGASPVGSCFKNAAGRRWRNTEFWGKKPPRPKGTDDRQEGLTLGP